MSSSRLQIEPLTSIRFYAILWIIFFHFHLLINDIDNWYFVQIMRYAYIALDSFFILSGFIISYVYFEKFSNLGKVKKNVSYFILYRLARIYPLHIVTLLFCFILYKSDIILLSNSTNETLMMHLLLVQGWMPQEIALSWNYPSWSVSLEWAIYLLYPILGLLLLGIRKSNISILIYIIASILIYFNVYNRDYDDPIDGVIYYSWAGGEFMRAALDFVTGMCMLNLRNNGFLKNASKDYLLLLTFAIIAICIFTNAPEAAIIPILPWMIFFLSDIKGKIRKIFDNKFVYIMGDASYSLYLWHIPVAHTVASLYMRINGIDYESAAISTGKEFDLIQINYLVFFPLCIAILFPLSLLSNKYIEKPCRKYAKKVIFHE